MKSKQECGRLGGQTTAQRYGHSYMSEIGRRGAKSFWQKYMLYPIGTSYFALVFRDTGQLVTTILWRQK